MSGQQRGSRAHRSHFLRLNVGLRKDGGLFQFRFYQILPLCIEVQLENQYALNEALYTCILACTAACQAPQ